MSFMDDEDICRFCHEVDPQEDLIAPCLVSYCD